MQHVVQSKKEAPKTRAVDINLRHCYLHRERNIISWLQVDHSILICATSSGPLPHSPFGFQLHLNIKALLCRSSCQIPHLFTHVTNKHYINNAPSYITPELFVTTFQKVTASSYYYHYKLQQVNKCSIYYYFSQQCNISSSSSTTSKSTCHNSSTSHQVR